jgi:hypothetical protein
VRQDIKTARSFDLSLLATEEIGVCIGNEQLTAEKVGKVVRNCLMSQLLAFAPIFGECVLRAGEWRWLT